MLARKQAIFFFFYIRDLLCVIIHIILDSCLHIENDLTTGHEECAHIAWGLCAILNVIQPLVTKNKLHVVGDWFLKVAGSWWMKSITKTVLQQILLGSDLGSISYKEDVNLSDKLHANY